ncbi:cold shock domain-containing protein [Frankia sp. Ag45/Mut15]|uniref:Cold shock domain-containing protein n=1 Tax=Frankia umida TaxID=573489 RepID=A0ABT0JVF8_9ACTN|nr:cold shock domain-containing protein [Frankia umida]MCK9875512.1 cold shock domain-containing protein [Frankia umida]
MALLTRGARIVLAVVPVLLAAACADATVYGRGGGVGGGADGGAKVALRVDWIGGFVTPQMLVTRLPIVAVYADGRVVDTGPEFAIAPGPAWPNVQLRRISVADVRRLLELAAASGVGRERDYGQPPVTDVPATRFTMQDADGVTTAEVPALLESDGTGLTPHQQAARRAARKLYDALTDLPATLGAGAVGEPTPFTPTAVAAVASPWTDPCTGPAPVLEPASTTTSSDTPISAGGAAPGGLCADGLPRQPERVWPGPRLPGEPIGDGLDVGCVTAVGGAATAVIEAAREAVATTPWTSDGRLWRVNLRPLLPDESDCADLRAAS